MPAYTSPDNIQYPVSTDQVAPLETVFANLAESVQDALDNVNGQLANREIQSFVWANATEQTNQTGMQPGDVGYRTDTKNYYFRDTSAWISNRTVLLARATVQSIPNATDTTIVWDAPTQNYGGFTYSAGVLTVPIAGIYQFTFRGMWAANGSATGIVRRLYVTKNGTTTREFDNHLVATAATAETAMSQTGMIDLAAGDTIQFRVIHNGGVALNLGPLTNGTFSCRVVRLGGNGA